METINALDMFATPDEEVLKIISIPVSDIKFLLIEDGKLNIRYKEAK